MRGKLVLSHTLETGLKGASGTGPCLFVYDGQPAAQAIAHRIWGHGPKVNICCADDTSETAPPDASAVRSSLLQGCMGTELSSASAASNARLLLAFALRSSSPAQEIGSLVSTLLKPRALSEGVQASAGRHAGSEEPAPAQEADPAAPSSGLQASQLLLADALVSPSSACNK